METKEQKEQLENIRKLIKWYRNDDNKKSFYNYFTKEFQNEINYFSTEPETICLLIIPFLKLLGWKDTNIMFEFFINGENSKIDILICKDNERRKPYIIIEAKKIDCYTTDFISTIVFNDAKLYYEKLNKIYCDSNVAYVDRKNFNISELNTIIATDGDFYYVKIKGKEPLSFNISGEINFLEIFELIGNKE